MLVAATVGEDQNYERWEGALTAKINRYDIIFMMGRFNA